MAEARQGGGEPGGARPERAAPESRPAFADGFPRDPELDALVAAFQAGDFARVRRGVRALLASGKDESVKQGARALVLRTQADPLQTLLLAVSAVLLVLLSAWWIAHGGGSGGKG